MSRITLAGAIFLIIIALMPILLNEAMNVPFAVGTFVFDGEEGLGLVLRQQPPGQHPVDGLAPDVLVPYPMGLPFLVRHASVELVRVGLGVGGRAWAVARYVRAGGWRSFGWGGRASSGSGAARSGSTGRSSSN